MGDRSDYDAFVRAIRENGPWDCLIEMIGGVPADAKSLIEAARGMAPHVIFCSTTTVYGRPFERVPVIETGARLEPPSPYGENKLACETLLRKAEARGDFAVTVVRPAHIYNERSSILHSLGNRSSHLDRIRKGRRIVVHDDGLGLWSCLWADDCGAAVAAAVFSEDARGKTFHLAGTQIFSWMDYHAMLAKALDFPLPEIVRIPSETLAQLAPVRSLQCQRTLRFPGVYDCSAARQCLAFCPTVSPEEGLARNVRYLVENKQIEPWSDDAEYEAILCRYVESTDGNSREMEIPVKS